MKSSYYLSGGDWLIPLAFVFALASLAVFWAYRNAPTDKRTRSICSGLKILGVFLLLLCLLDPMSTIEKAKPRANLLALVADTSEGLNVRDAGSEEFRSVELGRVLGTKSENWQASLAEDFRLKRYSFDTRLGNLRDFDDLKFEGSVSRLGESLRTLSRRFRNQPLAGIVVFTDGVATDLDADLSSLPELPPVYPVIVGKGVPERDVSVTRVGSTQTSFEDSPVTISGSVQVHGCKGEEVLAKLELLDANGSSSGLVLKQSRKVVGPDVELDFRFQVRPAGSGVLFYRFSVGASGSEPEVTKANNSRMLVVDRGDFPYRVLYVSGRANWEFKFLKRALAEDDKIALVGLVRIAKKEPKFTFKGRRGETSNPLFRGFKNEGQDAEEYDKPVLIRLDTRDSDELKSGFPVNSEVLYSYDAIVVDDLEAAFFTPDQHSLIREFVNRRGGGLLMLGGQESFRQGGYDRTAVGGMLPVYLDRMSKLPALKDLNLKLTREGWLKTWMRLRDNETDERDRLADMPTFMSLNQVRSVKPGASVLASVDAKGKSGSFPAVVTQKFGRGRVAAVLLGDVWRWGLAKVEHHEDMDRAWRQMIRWLVSDVPPFIGLSADQSSVALGRELEVVVRDKDFQPLDNARVALDVLEVGSTDVVRLTAEADEEKAGVYSASFIPRSSGGYLVAAEVRDSTGKVIGSRRTGWSTDFSAAEYSSLSPNFQLLEALAHKTGGKTLTFDDLDGFAEMLPNLRAPLTEVLHSPVWHQAPFFLLALACFVSEWFLRRRKGLP